MDTKQPYTLPTHLLAFIFGAIFGGIAFHAFLMGDIKNSLIFIALAIGFLIIILLDNYLETNSLQIADTLRNFRLLPKPTEASMFVMALTALILLISSNDLWTEIKWTLEHDDKGKTPLIFIYILVGISLSIFHAFSQREKTNFEQETLKWFSAVTMAGIAISTAVYVYYSKEHGYLVFTIWNAFQALVILFLSGRNHVGEFIQLPKRNARLAEILFGIIVVIVVLGIERLYFGTHWSIAFSSVLVVWSIADNYFEETSWFRNSRILGNKHGFK
jgi:hypothetical protein